MISCKAPELHSLTHDHACGAAVRCLSPPTAADVCNLLITQDCSASAPSPEHQLTAAAAPQAGSPRSSHVLG